MQAGATLCLGISHKTSPLALRERVTCTPRDLQESLDSNPKLAAHIAEWVVLSTCNRFEIYASLTAGSDEGLLFEWLQQRCPFDLAQALPHFYVYREEKVARHLMAVAAGLESQVLGEPQILGQVSEALARARASSGPHLKALFLAAIRAGKRARSETAISRQPSSVSSVAVSHIEATVGPLADRSFLILGAGEMARLAINSLRKRGAARIAVANRTCRRAQVLLEELGGEVFGFHQLLEALTAADVVVSATAAPHLVLTEELVSVAQTARGHRPILLVDIAVPRDIEPSVASLQGVQLINLDVLNDRLESARAAREGEVPLVKAIVAEEMHAWQLTENELRVRPLIRELRKKAEGIRQRELERTLKNLVDVDPATKKQVAHLSRALVNQLLHQPTLKLRQSASNGDGAELETAVKNLFDLVL